MIKPLFLCCLAAVWAASATAQSTAPAPDPQPLISEDGRLAFYRSAGAVPRLATVERVAVELRFHGDAHCFGLSEVATALPPRMRRQFQALNIHTVDTIDYYDLKGATLVLEMVGLRHSETRCSLVVEPSLKQRHEVALYTTRELGKPLLTVENLHTNFPSTAELVQWESSAGRAIKLGENVAKTVARTLADARVRMAASWPDLEGLR